MDVYIYGTGHNDIICTDHIIRVSKDVFISI